MDKAQFAYTIYIRATPQAVWAALTDAELSARYWERQNVSDWKVGSRWTHGFAGQAPDVVGEVLESDPPRRLVTSWAAPADAGDPAKRSHATYLIEDLDGKVRLTVTHADLSEQGLQDVSQGWPAVLSNLKTFLETGETMPDPFSRFARGRANAEA